MTKKEEEIPIVEGYLPEQKTISLLWANIWSIVLLIVLGGLYWLLYEYFWNIDWKAFNDSITTILLFLIAIIVGIVVHELIHGITWIALTGMNFSHLKFGEMKGAAYCHIDVPMVKRHYVIGALTPLLLLGIVPSIVGLVCGSLFWYLLGLLFTATAIGDMMIVWKIRKEEPTTLVYDHPSEGGCYVYRPINNK